VRAFSCDRVVFSSCLAVLLIFFIIHVLLTTCMCYYVGSNKRKVNGMKTRILLIASLLASAAVSLSTIYALLWLVGVV